MSEQGKPRILLLYYSHSGDAGRVAETLATSLQTPEVELLTERIRPISDYSYPWRSIGRFFGILPECHLGPLPTIEPLNLDGTRQFDLVVLIYQVWFLAPSLPVQSFMLSEAARLLRGVKVMTISVSRNMWHSASESMKRLLRDAGARHIDHVSITHQGPAWATFVTTPRSLLWGKKEAFWGIFPPAGISTADLAGVTRFGHAILKHRERLKQSDDTPLLRGLGAVKVNPRYVVPELIGWYWFRGWARLIRLLGRFGSMPRQVGVYLFVACLVLMILFVLPLTLLLRLLFYPWVRRWTAAYVGRLEQPSGP